MDNLCHTLAGAALGEAGLKHRTARGLATLMIASNLPDIDVAVFATDTLAMAFRRGWTHGVLAMAVLPAALAAVMLLWDRWRGPTPDGAPATFRGLALLAYLGTWLHVFMDFLNSYGVRLLMPFSERWFYGDALYIVDPILYVVFGAAIVVARRRAGATGPRAARLALAAAAGYVLVMVLSNQWARAEVRGQLVRAGREASTRFMVTPVLGNPFRREVLIDTGERYEKAFLWFSPAPHLRPAGYGVDTGLTDPAAREAAAQPRVQAYLGWSRFPFFVVERQPARTTIWLNDYRYSGANGRDGWSSLMTEVPTR